MCVGDFFPVDYCGFSPCNQGCQTGIGASSPGFDPSSRVGSVACYLDNPGRLEAFLDSNVVGEPVDRRLVSKKPV